MGGEIPKFLELEGESILFIGHEFILTDSFKNYIGKRGVKAVCYPVIFNGGESLKEIRRVFREVIRLRPDAMVINAGNQPSLRMANDIMRAGIPVVLLTEDPLGALSSIEQKEIDQLGLPQVDWVCDGNVIEFGVFLDMALQKVERIIIERRAVEF